MIYFDNDYMAGAHPKVLQRLCDTNLEMTVGYGCDHYTTEAQRIIRTACGDNAENPGLDIHFLVGGTQTNATVIDALLHHTEGVLAATTSHINVHESGAIEASGHKVLTLPTHDGKVNAQDVEAYLHDFYADDTYEHMVAPGMLYISFPTEYGTLYSQQELTELYTVCRQAKIPLYIDGARLGYGLASTACDITLCDLPQMCDIFYIGGTKVGALFGECVVARKELLSHFFPIIKQHGALLAKGRLLALQFATLFTDDLYLEISQHADETAMMLRKAFTHYGYPTYIDSYTNQQFFVLPNDIIDRLHATISFEYSGPRGERESVVRFVTSWATKQSDVDQVRQALSQITSAR